MERSSLVVIVLAGNDEDSTLLGGVGSQSKFCLEVGRQWVAERILDAVDGLLCCRSVYVAAPPALVAEASFASQHPLHLVNQGTTRTGSMLNALQEAQSRGDYSIGSHVLVLTGDLPLLSTAALEHYLAACEQAGEADCYIGMVPISALSRAQREAYMREYIPFRGGLWLHTDVYLVRPHCLTERARLRFERLMAVRRANLKRPRDVARVTAALLQTVGFAAVPVFMRFLLRWPRAARSGGRQAAGEPDLLERLALDLVHKRFGLRLALVMVDEPGLALDVDDGERLTLLSRYASR